MAFISKKRKKKQKTTTEGGKKTLFNLMWPYWKLHIEEEKNTSVFLYAVYSPWENLCIAQKQADASLLCCLELIAAALQPPSPCRAAFWREPSFPVYKYNNPLFFFVFFKLPRWCPAPSHFLVQRLTSAVSSFSAFFGFSQCYFSLKKKKKSCGLMCWQSKRVYVENSLSE